MAVQRIGIFGGTFDPIHYTHLDVARVALTAANLDRVIFVVSARPPHKHDATQATPEQRLAMVEAALIHEPRMVASAVELHRSGLSYTYETLDHFADEYPGAEFFLILGMDALKDLPKWKHPDRILLRARLLVVPRAEDNVEVPESMEGKFILLPFETSTVSSTDIRRRAASGEDLHDLVPPGTLRVMREERIYSAGA